MSGIYKVKYWPPRILGILFICFITLFSFDVFDSEDQIGEQLIGFLIHNIPSIILAISLFFAWKRELIGVFVFALAASLYVIFAIINAPNTFMALNWSMLIAFPAYLVSYLFYVSWKKSRRGRVS